MRSYSIKNSLSEFGQISEMATSPMGRILIPEHKAVKILRQREQNLTRKGTTEFEEINVKWRKI